MSFRPHRFLCAIGFALAFAMPLAARAADGPVAGLSLVSDYVFRGQHLGGASAQPSLEGKFGDWDVGLWASLPLEKPTGVASDPELNPWASRSIALGRGVTLVPGVTAYLFPESDSGRGGYRFSIEPNVALYASWQGVLLAPRLSLDPRRKGVTAELGAALALPLTALGTELDFSATLGVYRERDAIRGGPGETRAGGRYGQLGVSVPYQLNYQTRIQLGLSYSFSDGLYLQPPGGPRSGHPLAANRAVASLGLQRSF